VIRSGTRDGKKVPTGFLVVGEKENRPTVRADVEQFVAPPPKSAGWPLPQLPQIMAYLRMGRQIYEVVYSLTSCDAKKADAEQPLSGCAIIGE